MVIGSEDYCYCLEKRLRPNKYIGWNIAAGGLSPPTSINKKHGLSKNPAGKRFLRLKHKYTVTYPEWKGDQAIENFVSWLEGQENYTEDCIVSLREASKGVHPNNLKISANRRGAWGDTIYSEVRGYGKTALNWSRELGIPVNTINYRLIRGWSEDEALGFSKRGCISYKKQSLENPTKVLALERLQTTPMCHHKIAKEVGFNSTLRRSLHHFEVPEWMFEKYETTVNGRIYRLHRRGWLNTMVEVHELILKILSGETVNSCAKDHSVSHTTMKSFFKEVLSE